MATIVNFPKAALPAGLAPVEAVDQCRPVAWQEFVGFGIDQDGDFVVFNSDMTAEHALWLIEHAREWAMGIDDGD